MKRYISLLLIFQVGGLLVGCSSMTLMTYIKKPHNKIIYVDGDKYLESHKKNSLLILKVENFIVNGKRAYAWMSFKNLSNRSHFLDPSRIKIVRKSKRDRVAILSYNELTEEVNSSRRIYTFLAILGGVARGLSAGTSSYSGRVNTSEGSVSYSGSSYSSTLAKIETDQYSRDVGRTLANFDNKKKDLKNSILKQNTVFPNKEISGLIAIEWPELEQRQDYFVLLVKFANDKHRFYLKQSLED